MSAVNFSEVEELISLGISGLEPPSEQFTESASLIISLSFCQISSILSQEGAKGGSAKEQAFQLDLTGTLSC